MSFNDGYDCGTTALFLKVRNARDTPSSNDNFITYLWSSILDQVPIVQGIVKTSNKFLPKEELNKLELNKQRQQDLN